MQVINVYHYRTPAESPAFITAAFSYTGLLHAQLKPTSANDWVVFLHAKSLHDIHYKPNAGEEGIWVNHFQKSETFNGLMRRSLITAECGWMYTLTFFIKTQRCWEFPIYGNEKNDALSCSYLTEEQQNMHALGN